ncbi:hypothetical protein [Fibrobacter succinogenes]|uniref:hypothetical protein n=1 Tax=Fibrobacter succinogenes TaxID=833 RepID=UPI001566BF4A|nr:hypothetical protein [Fibrobacter succinogenes]
MAAKIPKKYYFPQKNAQALNLDVFEKGWGMFLLRLVRRLKTRWHPADKKDAVLAPVTTFPLQAEMH